ncbi:MAG: hypothetical protein M3Y34_09050 [Actinomycetota bacterium]|nr:hypothetical protein [Actinomycetota bacterium]
MADEHGSEEQEGFGEAGLGEAQSADAPNDPEMIEDDADQDAGPASTEDELDPGGERDQAEG